METMKFKVGDKVRVKSLEWYNSNKNAEGKVYKDGISSIYFTEGMTFWCGKIVQIEKIFGDTYYLVDGSYCHWQDWMFEDEVVTEEKHEDKQLNKTNMETKEMTRKEVTDYLRNTKVLCTSAEQSQEVQKKLFELKYYYPSNERKIKEDAYLFYIYNELLQYGSDFSSWVSNKSRRIDPNEILAIQLKEEKPKFDPTSLKPFDKVLVRYSKKDDWKCSLFSHLNKNEDVICVNVCVYGCWDFCIPYNDETKHLVGTTEDEPELYRI